MEPLNIFLLVAVAVVLLYLFSSVKIVTQGYQYTIEYFGRFTAVAAPGHQLFYPFLSLLTSKGGRRSTAPAAPCAPSTSARRQRSPGDSGA